MTDDDAETGGGAGSRTIEAIAADVLGCASAWEPDVRLIGNVTADEVASLAMFALRRRARDRAEPAAEEETP